MKNLIRKWLGINTDEQVAKAAEEMINTILSVVAYGGVVIEDSPEHKFNAALSNRVRHLAGEELQTALAKEDILQQLVERIRKVQL